MIGEGETGREEKVPPGQRLLAESQPARTLADVSGVAGTGVAARAGSHDALAHLKILAVSGFVAGEKTFEMAELVTGEGEGGVLFHRNILTL